jgi:ribosome-binding protein aMBF1 (putative translation factor)
MVTFRNLTVSPDQPVEQWTTEGVLSALERGSLKDWRRLARAIQAEPHGVVADDIMEAVEITESRGVAAAMRRVVQDARMSEAERIARRVRGCIRRSGLTQATFAARIGTSQSRLSTYARGTVTPSAVVMARIERAATPSDQTGGTHLPSAAR